MEEDLLSGLAAALNRRNTLTRDVASEATLFTRNVLVDQDLALGLHAVSLWWS